MAAPTPGQLLAALARAAPGADEVLDRLLAVADAYRRRVPLDATTRALGDVLASIRAAADLVGRAGVWLDRAGPKPVAFAALDPILCYQANPLTGAVPRVLPLEAVADLVSRIPELAQSAEEVRAVYNRGHGFALARSASELLTERVQAALVRAFVAGTPLTETVDLVQALGDWPAAYAEVVVRTNLTTAHAAGRFREAAKLQELGLVAALRYRTMGDAEVRRGREVDRGENHAAMDGFVAALDDPVWDGLAPPLGYNCRCVVTPVDEGDLTPAQRVVVQSRRAARPAGAVPHAGFGRRPDLQVYGFGRAR